MLDAPVTVDPIESDAEEAAIVADEQRTLARVSAALSQLNIAETGAPDYDEALVNLRDQMADAKPEDLAPLVEQMTRISAIAQRYGRGRNLPVNPQSPYFAHLRLREEAGRKDILIGKHGFIDRQHNVKIVDWRNAPVSRIYYRYEEGDDYDEQFGDRDVEGVVEARRTLTIDSAILTRISCPQGVLVSDGSGRWHKDRRAPLAQLSGGQGKASRPPPLRRGGKQSSLGAESLLKMRADKHLPEVAALIDPTQFELITQPESGLVVLQGGAGTGKTTVALHRVAYLNYQRPKLFPARAGVGGGPRAGNGAVHRACLASLGREWGNDASERPVVRSAAQAAGGASDCRLQRGQPAGRVGVQKASVDVAPRPELR